MRDKPKAIVLMGVSGSGKTSVGKRLSQLLGWPFFDGDDFHSEENKEKMAAGSPLNDDDRAPWLASLNDLLVENLNEGKSILLACSALKQDYRNQISEDTSGTIFVYLKGDFDVIFERMRVRTGHYMKAKMLESQFESLEEPTEVITIDVRKSLEEITKEIIAKLGLK
jgi:carbohydrate kinase (thermoresistant glucokinase family)